MALKERKEFLVLRCVPSLLDFSWVLLTIVIINHWDYNLQGQSNHGFDANEPSAFCRCKAQPKKEYGLVTIASYLRKRQAVFES